MMSTIVRTVPLLGVVAVGLFAQQAVIPLPTVTGVASAATTYPEQQYFSKTWKTNVVANVTRPTLTVFKPAAGQANGTGIVVCPGGGFMALSIDSEGNDVAKWLAAHGVTAFVLRYRLAHTGADAAEEFNEAVHDKQRFKDIVAKVVPLSIADGQAAVAYVRQHAAEFNVEPDRVGIVGFSAGGTVAAAAGWRYKPESRPAFAAPIYGAIALLGDAPVPADAPPMFVAAATDDGLNLTGDSVQLYDRWLAAHKSAELHIYAKGGHGFGMRKQGLPSDEWIDQFGEWLRYGGWLAREVH